MSDPIDKLSWDDLRVIRAVGKNGALAPAAEMLDVNSSTIARRLSKVEETLGVTLFDRRRTGYVITAQGKELIALAERVDSGVRTTRPSWAEVMARSQAPFKLHSCRIDRA